MDRRGFLKGLMAAPAGAALVITASPSEVVAFDPKIEEPVMIARPVTRQNIVPELGEPVFDSQGRILGFIDSTCIECKTTGLITMDLRLIVNGHGFVKGQW